jgi:aryl-alcohol dehydrogenase-like predicted oxidoreductase
MQDLKKQGKIRNIGLSAYSDADFTRLAHKVQPTCLQSWAHSADIRFIKEGSPTRKLMDERKISFVAFSPLAQGLLLGKYKPGQKVSESFAEGDHRKGSGNFSEENLTKMAAKVDKLKARFGDDVKSLARAALQYLLSFPCTACVIPGFRNKDQVEVNLWGADKPLSKEDVAFIRQTFDVN